MKKVLTGMLAVAGLMAVAPAMAASTWTFSNRNDASGNGNTETYTSGGVSVTASAWANTVGSSNTLLETAHLGSYGGGLGVTNRDKNSGDSGEGSDPEHGLALAMYQWSCSRRFRSAHLLNSQAMCNHPSSLRRLRWR